MLCGGALSTNKGGAGSWGSIPHPGGSQDSNPNDGAAAADPNNPACFYFTTDLAIGTTTCELLRAEGERLHSRKLRAFNEPPFR